MVKKICFLILCMLLLVPLFTVNAEDNVSTTDEVITTTNNDDLGESSCTNEECDEVKENEKQEEDGIITDGKSAILIEASTGEVLYEKNTHDRYAPASMTKIMSMILIMEEIEKGNLNWDDTLTASSSAASMGGSQIFLQANEKMSVKDLFKAVAIGSANDATIVFAEKIAGTEEKFVQKMNEKAKELGLKDTNFKNATGLDEANHYSSAYDMAIMAQELVKHEEIFKYTTIYEDYLRQNTDNKFWLVNTNKLIKTYEGADGLKTGYTKEAGYCLTATAKKDNMRIIGVIMGASTSSSRNEQMMSLLDYGFNSYQMQVEVKQGDVVSRKKLGKAQDEVIEIVTKYDASVLVENGSDKKDLNYEMKLSKMKLPIKKGDEIGVLRLKDGNKVVSEIPLTVNKTVKKASIFELYKRSIKIMLSGSY